MQLSAKFQTALYIKRKAVGSCVKFWRVWEGSLAKFNWETLKWGNISTAGIGAARRLLLNRLSRFNRALKWVTIESPNQRITRSWDCG